MIEKELKSIQSKVYALEIQLEKYRGLESILPLEDVSDLIRKERKKQGLTLKGLSELSSISFSTLVKLESGDDRINLKTLKQVVKTLGLKLWAG